MYSVSILITSLLMIVYASAYAQDPAIIKGSIIDTEGEVLPYAHVLSLSTGDGTSSNENGAFKLELPAGEHRISVQYIGYKTTDTTLYLQPGELRSIDISLEVKSFEITEVLIKGDRNPADEIIQHVIDRRKEFLRASNPYEVEVYIKGSYRIHDVPEKFLGRKTGGIDSLLQGLPSNIIYLSETHSLFTKIGSKEKELILASKTSGMSSLPSINNANLLDFNIYENHPELMGQKVKSPVAEDAFQHYQYTLMGVDINAEGSQVFKIGFTPKIKVGPYLEGFVEVKDQDWIIQSLSAHVEGEDIQQEILDSLQIRQTYYPLAGRIVWPLVQTEFYMDLSAFGFRVSGGFTGIYDHYTFELDSFSNVMNRNQLEYSEVALEKDTGFWKEQRPIELSEEEQLDYSFKDSLERILTDSGYLDSLERVSNVFRPQDLFLGYQFSKEAKGFSLSVSSPLTQMAFNPVQGINLTAGIDFQKLWDREKHFKKLSGGTDIIYGFADNSWRHHSQLEWQSGEYDPLTLTLSGGNELKQVNNQDPISLRANEFSNLFFKNHYIRFYESKNLNFKISRKFNNGFYLNLATLLEARSTVSNNSQYSIFKRDQLYQENIPHHQDLSDGSTFFDEHKILKTRLTVIYEPGLSYLLLPNNRLEVNSGLPVFTLEMDWGMPVLFSESNFLKITAKVAYQMSAGIAGNSSIVTKSGGFLYHEDLSFYDYHHFSGNQFFISDASYEEDFLLLPYYTFSTQHFFTEMHWSHAFEGYLLNRIPLVRKSGFTTVTKASYLYHKDLGNYTELSLGLDRLGWGIFRIFRLDFVSSFRDWQYQDWGLILGTKVNLSDLAEM